MKIEIATTLIWLYLPLFLACVKMIFREQTEFNDRKIVNLLLLSIASATFVIASILLVKLQG